MPSGKKKKRHKMSTHKRKKRLRKNRHKTQKIIITLHDPGLLQDNLRNPYNIRVGGIPPRQFTLVSGIPDYQFLTEYIHLYYR